MPSSIVVAAISALQDVYRDALPAGFPVTVGPPVGDIPDRYAAVAYGGDDRAAIVGQGEPTGMPFPSETFGVWSTISMATGDTNPLAHMLTVDGLYRPVAAAIVSDPRLRGAVPAPGVAEVGPYEWTVEPGGVGTIVTVFFQVVVRGALLS